MTWYLFVSIIGASMTPQHSPPGSQGTAYPSHQACLNAKAAMNIHRADPQHMRWECAPVQNADFAGAQK